MSDCLWYRECGAAFSNGAAKPAGLDCANVAPVANSNCTGVQLTEYGIAITLPYVYTQLPSQHDFQGCI